MAVKIPVTELHAGLSSPGATPTSWAEGRRHIYEAEVFWLSTVRPDGRPHATPLLAVWHDDALYFFTVRRSARQRTSDRTHSAFSPLARTVSTVSMSWSKDAPSRSAMQRSSNRSPTPTSRSTGRTSRHPRARGLVSATRSAPVRRSSTGLRPRRFSASARVSSSVRRDGALPKWWCPGRALKMFHPLAVLGNHP